MVQEPGAPARTPLAEEILQAIAKEPTVRLEKLHIRELLTSCGEMTDQEVDDLLERARRQGG